MKTESPIIGIYSSFEVEGESKLYFCTLFNGKGLLEKSSCLTVYEQCFIKRPATHPNALIGPFENRDEMNKFSYALCQELESPQINLFSVKQMNEAFESCQEIPSFKEYILENGDAIQNADVSKGKNFFSKLFH